VLLALAARALEEVIQGAIRSEEAQPITEPEGRRAMLADTGLSRLEAECDSCATAWEGAGGDCEM